MNTEKLDFFVIGAQKCATSWLYYCLRDHPELAVPEKKYEPGYIGGEVFNEKGAGWFFDRFSTSDRSIKRGDVSVDYLYDLGAAAACKQYSHDESRFIASLRHPVNRAISSYFWYVRRTDLDYKPLEEGLAPLLDSKPGFPDALPGVYEQIVRRSCYANQLQTYLSHYSANQIKVCLYEDISAHPARTISDLYSFLNVDADFMPGSLKAQPKKNAHLPFLTRFERIANKKAVAKLANYMNQAAVLMGLGKKPALADASMKKLQELFEPQVDATRDVLSQLPEGNRPNGSLLRSLWTELPTVEVTND